MSERQTVFDKELLLLRRQRRRLLDRKELLGSFSGKVQGKIPDKLENTVQRAFFAALNYFLDSGAEVIGKALPTQQLLAEYREKEALLRERQDFSALRALDKTAVRSRSGNLALTAVEGAGLGLMGIGLPDIPLFLGMLLKSVRETALRYGYPGEGPWEQCYLLRVICGSLAGGSEGEAFWQQADRMAAAMDHRSGEPVVADLEEMTARTANLLAATLLAAKFIQDIAVVGAAGGAFNLMVLHRVERGAAVMYKKRRLERLRWELA